LQEVHVMQDPFQDPFQVAALGGDSGLGGASQAAVFRLLDAAASAQLGAAAAGGGQGLRVFWGPQTAVMRVGALPGAAETAASGEVMEGVETEHF
jgi:hypothetical protein